MYDSLPVILAYMVEGLSKLVFLSMSMSPFRWLGVYVPHMNFYLGESEKKVLQSIYVPN